MILWTKEKQVNVLTSFSFCLSSSVKNEPASLELATNGIWHSITPFSASVSTMQPSNPDLDWTQVPKAFGHEKWSFGLIVGNGFAADSFDLRFCVLFASIFFVSFSIFSVRDWLLRAVSEGHVERRHKDLKLGQDVVEVMTGHGSRKDAVDEVYEECFLSPSFFNNFLAIHAGVGKNRRGEDVSNEQGREEEFWNTVHQQRSSKVAMAISCWKSSGFLFFSWFSFHCCTLIFILSHTKDEIAALYQLVKDFFAPWLLGEGALEGAAKRPSRFEPMVLTHNLLHTMLIALEFAQYQILSAPIEYKRSDPKNLLEAAKQMNEALNELNYTLDEVDVDGDWV